MTVAKGFNEIGAPIYRDSLCPTFDDRLREMKSLFCLLMLSTLALTTYAETETPRGFDVGQTLPDISLINLDGEEVRFSDFLGKQYVLYGWASW